MEENLVKIGEKQFWKPIYTIFHRTSFKVLGRLHYQASYGQNVLEHSIESAWICGILAA